MKEPRWYTPEQACKADLDLWRQCLDATARTEAHHDPTYGGDGTYDEIHDPELAATLFSLHRWRVG